MSRIYLAGKIKDEPNYVAKFAKWEDWLTNKGNLVVNPVTISHAPDSSYQDFMRNDLIGLLSCSVIAMIPGWETSRGAKLEFQVATECGMSVIYLSGSFR